jgi:phage shock protein A
MATLLEKVSTLISANLHSLVDQALQSNSLAVIDQYIRQVEDQLVELGDATARKRTSTTAPSTPSSPETTTPPPLPPRLA